MVEFFRLSKILEIWVANKCVWWRVAKIVSGKETREPMVEQGDAIEEVGE